MSLAGKRVLVTGGTGSLGKALVRRLLLADGRERAAEVIVFSRDEAKQHDMRVEWDAIDPKAARILRLKIGDIRDYDALLPVVRSADIVVHAAALKQIPSCEYVPDEAVKTNVVATLNLIRAIRESSIEVALTISTDKACKPVNVMGMTKALQERLFIAANLGQDRTKFVCVRYGNVVSSRGSVVPLFEQQIRRGGPVTLTTREMTRFLLTLDRAVDAVLATLRDAEPGDTFVPRLPTASVAELADVMIEGRAIEVRTIGIRPGEKVHEVLVSEEEAPRTIEGDEYFVMKPMLAELTNGQPAGRMRTSEYSSREVTLDRATLAKMVHDALAAGHAD